MNMLAPEGQTGGRMGSGAERFQAPLPGRESASRWPAGKRLGPYQVEGCIGVDGMGEVYLAQDTRLRRAVALKVLLPESGSSPERLAPLQRKARMVPALRA